MHAQRLLPVLTVFAIASVLSACHRGDEPAFVQLTEARKLVAEMRVNFTKASDASDRAVLADTDEDSIKFAREAVAATEAVNATLPALTQRLSGLAHAGDTELLARFQERLARYRTVDGEILKLAVENTNLKAQRLLFGPVAQAANEFCTAVQSLATARASNDAVVRAQLAVREIQVLEAPHIAEAHDAEMDRLEKEMAARQTIARDALASMERGVRGPARTTLDSAKTSLDRFESLSRNLVELSRKNTNVRSLDLAMKQKPALSAACDESLATLQDALAARGFSGTR